MPYHGHVTALAFVGPGGIAFLSDDLGGVDIQRMSPASILVQTMDHDPAVHSIQPHHPFSFSGSAQPVPRRIRAGQMIQMQQAA